MVGLGLRTSMIPSKEGYSTGLYKLETKIVKSVELGLWTSMILSKIDYSTGLYKAETETVKISDLGLWTDSVQGRLFHRIIQTSLEQMTKDLK